MIIRLFLFFALLGALACNANGIPDYRRCPVGCNCTTMTMAVCDTMDFPSFGLDILKLKIIEPRKPLNIDTDFFSGRNLLTLDTIYIESATIEQIDSTAFDGLTKLVSVSFVNCTLPKLQPDAFLLATSLAVLEIDGCRLQQFDYLKSESISQLKISGAKLQKITNNTFAYMIELVSINLADNVIEEIDVNAFENLINLEDLNLANNKIQNLPPNIFASNEDLIILDLSGNPIKSVGTISAPYLEKLVLRHCSLKEFDGSQFTALDYLDLSHNEIAKISNTAFQNMPDLEYVDFTDNYFSTLPVDLFANNSRLQKIILDQNELQSLPRFENSETFETYYFSCYYCALETLDADTFDDMPGLVILNLSNNRIKELSPGVFTNVKSLVKLDLSVNLLSTIDINVFDKNTALSTLNLSGNGISYLNSNAFVNNGVLHNLDVSNNGLKQIWKLPSNNQIESLRVLNVANNRLVTITEQELQITKNLQTLNINGNEFRCNEELRKAIQWLTKNTVAPVIQNTHEELINIDNSWASASDDDIIWQDILYDSCDESDYDFTEDLSIINSGIEVLQSRPIVERIRYNFLWPILVFILTALFVLILVLNIILIVLRRRGQLPRNINLSWRNGHGGFVYKPLTEDLPGSQFHNEKSLEIPIVHSPKQ